MSFINGAVPDTLDIDSYRQLVFEEMMRELHSLVESLPGFGLSLPGQLAHKERAIAQRYWGYDRWDRPFLDEVFEVCTALLNDPAIQNGLRHGNQIGIQEK